MKYSNSSPSNSNIDDLFPCISCGVNADPADGFGKCTCGNEAKREAIQQELLKARIETLEWLLEQEVEFGGLELKQSIIDKVADLQKELKENNDEKI